MDVIYGLSKIGKKVGRTGATVKRWAEEEGFPASQAPNGVWITTDQLISSWIISRRKAQRDNPSTIPERNRKRRIASLRQWDNNPPHHQRKTTTNPTG